MADRRRKLLHLFGGILAALTLLYVLLCGGMYLLLRQSPPKVARVLDRLPVVFWIALPMPRIWTAANRGALKPGDPAPDFDLPTLDRKSRVKLRALRGGKPVVLVFGSYTCPPFRKRMKALLDVYERHRDRADFYFIYIQEAHATDAWPTDENERENVQHATPRSADERLAIASACSTELKIPFPMLVDGMDDHTDRTYSAWPIRLYVVNPDGRIRFKTEAGPFGFKPELLDKELAGIAAPAQPPV